MKKFFRLACLCMLLFGFAVSCEKDKLGVPSGLTADEITATTVKLSWTAPAGAERYNLSINDGASIDVSGTAHVAKDLTAKTVYTWKVRAVKDGAVSEWAHGKNFTTKGPEVKIPSPTDLSVSDRTHYSAKLSWKHEDADTHEVSINDAAAISTINLWHQATGLATKTTYTWKVRSAKAGVWSEWVTGEPFTTCSASPHNVYVVGNITYNAGKEGSATLWTNGIAQRLSDRPSTAAAVFVADNGDIYVAGTEYDENYTALPTVWKNGVAQHLSGAPAVVSDMSVVGTDIYLAGIDISNRRNPKAIAWKNDALEMLNNQGSEAYAIAVSDAGDVCVAGHHPDATTGTAVATLWKNSVEEDLATSYSFAKDVVCSGGDVYMAGYMHDSKGNQTATLWKNGTATTLSNVFSHVEGLCVSGKDTYVVGFTMNADYMRFATLWKNGTQQLLSTGEAWAMNVSVVDGNVYVVGYGENADQISVATIWVNGEAAELSEKPSSASAIFVK